MNIYDKDKLKSAGMTAAWWETPVGFLCDFWWVVLLIIILVLIAYFTRSYWLPL